MEAATVMNGLRARAGSGQVLLASVAMGKVLGATVQHAAKGVAKPWWSEVVAHASAKSAGVRHGATFGGGLEA